jgi:hypothetical protein
MLGKFTHGLDISIPGSYTPRRGQILFSMSRIVDPSGHSRKFIRGSDISVPGSSEIPAGTWAQLSAFVSISLTHLFSKEEGLGNAMASLAGSSHGAC